MPTLVNSLDVMLVLNLDSKFGNYSYPVKIYEARNCNIPVVAGDTKNVSWILYDQPEMLASAGDTNSYLTTIFKNLENNYTASIKSNWEASCDILDKEIRN